MIDLYHIKSLVVIVSTMFGSKIINAQPANDDICSATSLSVNSNRCISGTNTDASTVSGDPIGTCWIGGTKSHTVWYTFIAPASGNITVTTDHADGGSLTDPQLAVFSSSDETCSGILTEIDCNDDINSPGNLNSSITIMGLSAGSTYFVLLDGYGSDTGSFCIDIHDGGPVLANDSCADAMNLWIGDSCNFQLACTYTNFPELHIATEESWETAPNCWSQGLALNTVWYKFTALDSSTSLKIEADGGPDPHAAVYTGTSGNLTLHACQEDKASGGGPGSANRGVDLTFPTTPGQIYYIQYDSDVEQGCNNICLSSAEGLTVPENQDCASAIPISGDTTVRGNNWLAGADGSSACGSVTNTVWYRFTPPVSAEYYFVLGKQEDCSKENNTSSSHTGFYAANLEMIVYDNGNCTPGTDDEITCSSSLNTNDIEVSASLTAANEYLIAIDGLDNSSCSFEFRTSNSSTLPVGLTSFEGWNEGKLNILAWNTATETNNDFFVIQRSQDAVNFVPVGTVPGAGNSTRPKNYFFTDNNPLPGIGYYRLVQVDYNGGRSYPGESIAIAYSQLNTFKVYPNPGNGKSITIHFATIPEEELLISITNMHGSIYYSQFWYPKKNNYILQIPDINNLSEGIYLITAKGKYQFYKQKIVVI